MTPNRAYGPYAPMVAVLALHAVPWEWRMNLKTGAVAGFEALRSLSRVVIPLAPEKFLVAARASVSIPMFSSMLQSRLQMLFAGE